MIGTISQFATFGLVGYGLYDYKLSLKERRIKNYFEIAKRFSSDKQIQEILNLLEKKIRTVRVPRRAGTNLSAHSLVLITVTMCSIQLKRGGLYSPPAVVFQISGKEVFAISCVTASSSHSELKSR